MDEDDELIEQAIEVIRQMKRASTSGVQRRLKIGYTRAARIMDILEEKGIVGPANGSDPREILIDLEGDIPHNSDDETT
jgi:S-DNA-T family DNA segregation ATPase FtsK/SpoIIIE